MSDRARVIGVFVGGRSLRMGTPKGRLVVDGEPLLVRTVRVAREAGLDVVLVGDASPYGAIADVEAIDDRPRGIGPLGGLSALLHRAAPAIALACDMPRVDAAHLERLATMPSSADVLAARRAGDAPWEPLFARWSPSSLPAIERAIEEGVRSFQRVLAQLSVERFEVDDERVLDDWDTPEDVTA